jgi:Tn3 transposase DDE domain
MAWNTAYVQEILKELKEEGYEVNVEDFDHFSPAVFEHINRLGKHNFKDEIKLEENGLRALRKPKGGFGFKKN